MTGGTSREATPAPRQKCVEETKRPFGAGGGTARWQSFLLEQGAAAIEQSGDGVLEHSADWLLAQCDEEHKAVLVLNDQSARVISFFVHDGQVDFNLGEVSVAHVKVRRHVLVGNFPEITVETWLEAFAALAHAVSGNAAVFLLGVVQNEGLQRVLDEPDLRKLFFVLPQGASYKRRLCDVSKGFDAYLGSLSSKSRQSMRRSLKRFEAHFDGRFTLQLCQSTADVAHFLERVEPVSKRTYQGRMLGLAVTRAGYVGSKVMEGARLGYARCYLLAVDQKPVAWRIGLVKDGFFCSHHIGYDPEFKDWHPGVLMHLYSVRHMAEVAKDVRVLDLLYGDNDFKRRASNRSRDEQNYYLFPRTLRGALTYSCLAMCNLVSGSLGRLLERAGLKAKLKAALRRA